MAHTTRRSKSQRCPPPIQGIPRRLINQLRFRTQILLELTEALNSGPINKQRCNGVSDSLCPGRRWMFSVTLYGLEDDVTQAADLNPHRCVTHTRSSTTLDKHAPIPYPDSVAMNDSKSSLSDACIWRNRISDSSSRLWKFEHLVNVPCG